jgi:hypothetical protein
MKWLLCLCLLFVAGCCCPSRYPVIYSGDPWKPVYGQSRYQVQYQPRYYYPVYQPRYYYPTYQPQYYYPTYQPSRHYKRTIIRRIYHVENDWNRSSQYRHGLSY